MARRKNSNGNGSALSINVLDMDLDAMLSDTIESMEEKAKSAYGFFLPLTDMQNLAEKLLTVLEGKDVPFALLGNIAAKAIAPVIGESTEARKVAIDSFVGELWADIRRGAAFSGRKVSCKERPEVVGEWLHLYLPRPRKAEDAETSED